MLFNSYLFIFLFLPITSFGYLLLRRKNSVWPLSWLVLASLFYYGWWRPSFLLLLLASISINLLFARLLTKKLSQNLSRFLLALGVGFNLCALAYFKYAGFLVANLNELFAAGLPSPNVLLPLGISFITFQKIAFLVDAHRGTVRNFTVLNYLFFVTFFPQLIAGPIVHHTEIMPQLAQPLPRNLKADFAVGLSIFIVGLFKKVVIADCLAVYADAGYAMVKGGHALDVASAWITVLCYSCQLYFDFSAYSDMAIGLARLFGIRLPLNFYSPYKASSIIDFWRRWHITLSRFLRDYLYIPLGGNRRGFIRRYVNLFVVMLLGGLWHGANWTFVVWGGVHGLLLTMNHAWRKLAFTGHRFYQSLLMRQMAIAMTFLVVTLAWIPFRAENMKEVTTMLSYLFPRRPFAFNSFSNFWHAQFSLKSDSLTIWFQPHELWPAVLPPDYLATMALPVGLILVFSLLIIFILPNTSQRFANFAPAIRSQVQDNAYYGAWNVLNSRVAAILALMFVFSLLRLTHVSPFLYFQF